MNNLTAEQIAGIKAATGLSACPFCGNLPCDVPQNSSRPNGPGWWLFVWCEECNAQGPHRSTDEAAIAAWNRRASAPLPEGHALVPIEPTPEMIGAFWRQKNTGTQEISKTGPDTHDYAAHRAMLAASPAIPTARDGGATHRHKKRGTEYVLLGIGKMQADGWIDDTRARTGVQQDGPHVTRYREVSSVDMREVAIYRSVDDGSLWVRPREDFEDGRFEALSNGAQP